MLLGCKYMFEWNFKNVYQLIDKLKKLYLINSKIWLKIIGIFDTKNIH